MLSSATLTSRVERLVSAGRLVLAATALIATYFDPSEPARFAELTYGLLTAYTLYALVVALLAWPRATQPYLWTVSTHVLDMLFFGALIYFTEGPSSPFFLYFVFAIFSAALRLGLIATIWTAATAITVYVALGVYVSVILEDPVFELARFLVRGVYLGVVAVLLTHFTSYQRTILRELRVIAGLPRHVPETLERVIAESTLTAARLLRSSRVFLAWHDSRSPRLHLAVSDGVDVQVTEEVGDFAEGLLDLDRPESLILRGARRLRVIVRKSDGRVSATDGGAFDEELRSTFHIESALVCWFAEQRVRGAVIYADREDVTAEDVVVGEIVASIIGARLEQFVETGRATNAAATEARMRLGRDVHDSVLQSLTGTALQLEVLKRTIERDPAAAKIVAADLQEMVTQQQRELRAFVHDIQKQGSPEPEFDLVARFESLASRTRRQWDVDVRLAVDPLVQMLTNFMKHEVFAVVSEAVANAARHAAARTIEVSVRMEQRDVLIDVRDDGHGFAFTGEYDLRALDALRRGPVMLKNRVAAAGGRLNVASSSAGATVSVSLPLHAAGDFHADTSRHH